MILNAFHVQMDISPESQGWNPTAKVWKGPSVGGLVSTVAQLRGGGPLRGGTSERYLVIGVTPLKGTVASLPLPLSFTLRLQSKYLCSAVHFRMMCYFITGQKQQDQLTIYEVQNYEPE